MAGVLQLTLKDMPVSVYNRIYDDMMGTSSESADFSRNKSDVIQWMCKFDAESFNFLKTLMAFMHQLGTTAGNDANISQLVFIFAPLICRPTNSAYMSVRHMEDLRKLRPTLQVIVENYLEIFNAARPCATVDSKDQRGSHIRPLISDMDSYTTDICRSSSSDQVAYSPTQESMISGAESELESNYRQKKLALNLQVSLPPAPTTDVNDSNLSAVTVRQINFQSKEWNRLEQMVFAMSESFLRQPFQFFNPSNASTENDSGMVMSNENDLMACTIETFEVGNVGFGGGDIDSPTRDRDLGDFDDGRYWTQGGSLGTGELFSKSGRAPMSPSSIIGGSNGAAFRASSRRRMVHECRTLRQHITKFEKDFSLVHNRLPKGGDKGHMLPVYSKYRDMKREIRSSAAVDIQRIVRAFLCRSKLRKTKRMIPVSPSRFIRSPIRPSSSPGRTSNLIHELGSPPRPDSTALSRGNFDQNPVESNLWKSNVKGSSKRFVLYFMIYINVFLNLDDSGDFMDSGGSDDADGQFLYAKYKDLLLQKRTLKRRLKRFDEEFAAKYNRQPKKTDKEVMRPHYQKYHEVLCK